MAAAFDWSQNNLFIRKRLARWLDNKVDFVTRGGVLPDTSEWVYLFHWTGAEIEVLGAGSLEDAQILIECDGFTMPETRVFIRDTGEDMTDKLTFPDSKGGEQ